ncbi:MAG: DUF3579 domain-containing protein [Burkholderiaceae bacterium]
MPNSETPVSFVIVGRTQAGQTFRPSDWAERLCGVMSQYRPRLRAGSHLTYSPFVMPGHRDGAKAVFVDAALYALEPMAFRFLENFARDNHLVIEASTGPRAVGQSPRAAEPLTH